MFLSEWREFPSAPCLAGKIENLMTARVSILLKSRVSLGTCLRTCFLPGRAKVLSAPRYSDQTTDWISEELCFDSRRQQDIFLFSEAFRLTVEPNSQLFNRYPDHKVRHPRCVYNKPDCSVYTCLTQLYGGRDMYNLLHKEQLHVSALFIDHLQVDN